MRRREREGEMEMTLSRQLIRFHYDFSLGPERKTLEILTYFFFAQTQTNTAISSGTCMQQNILRSFLGSQY